MELRHHAAMAAIWSTESLVDLDAVYSKLAVGGWLALIVPDTSIVAIARRDSSRCT